MKIDGTLGAEQEKLPADDATEVFLDDFARALAFIAKDLYELEK